MIDPQQAQNQIKEVEATLQDLNAQRIQAKAELHLATVTLGRQQNLAKLQVVSRQDLDQAVTDLAVKNAKVGTIDAQINKAKASLDTAKSIWITLKFLHRWMVMLYKSPRCKVRR